MKSLFRYPGSKNKAAYEIISHFPNHRVYVDVFGGSAAVLRHKHPSKLEVYNDINSDLVNLFKVLAFRFEEFSTRIKWLVNSRELFYDFKKNMSKDPVERAVMSYYLLKFGFAGRRSGWPLLVNQHSAPKLDIPFLESVHKRLERVQFTNYDYETCIRKLDAKDTLFYLDPPYPGRGDLYHVDWDHEQFEAILSTIQGTWIMSYPVPIEEWHSKEIKIQYSMKKREIVTEYLISNHPLRIHGSRIIDEYFSDIELSEYSQEESL